MAIFIDSSDPAEIREFVDWGVVSGVTTNPKIIAGDAAGGKVDFKGRMLEIAAAAPVPVSVELTAEDEAGMIGQAERFHSWHQNFVIKVPLLPEAGLPVIRRLEREKNIRCNATCMMNFIQGYLAALAGATYVSLFWCRIRDLGADPAAAIGMLREKLEEEGLKARIIAGSIRQAGDVEGALAAGAHIVTVTPKVMRQLTRHPRTDSTIAEFNALWRQLKEKGQLDD